MTVMLTCPTFLEVFGVIVLSESHVESLRPSKSEAPLLLGPASKIFFITKKTVVQKAHQVAGVLPNVTTQLLELNKICCESAFQSNHDVKLQQYFKVYIGVKKSNNIEQGVDLISHEVADVKQTKNSFEILVVFPFHMCLL